MPEELLLTNAQVLTAARPETASAVVVRDGRIAAVGDGSLASAFPGARTVDLEGRTLLPGINDSHAHLGLFGATRPPLAVDVGPEAVSSIAEVAEAVRAAAADPPASGWIRGFGWDVGYLAECAGTDRQPTRHDLDEAVPDLPVVLQDFSGHAVWVNTEALRRAGVDRHSEAPAGGVVVRDADGEPTGLLQESAQGLVQDHLPALDRQAKRTALRAAIELMHAQGITSVTHGALGPGGEGYAGGVSDVEVLELLAEMVGPHELRMRVGALLLFSPLGSTITEDVLAGLAEYAPPEGRAGPEWFRIAGVKLFADGIPPNRTALMHDHYHGGGHGEFTISGDSLEQRREGLRRMVLASHEAGHQIGVHTTGDRAIDEVVTAFVAAQRQSPRPDPRHYVIHGDFTSADALVELARHGFGINMQPAIKSMIADMTAELLGDEHAGYEWPMRSAIDAGVPTAASSDAPVTLPRWLQGAADAVLRESRGSGRVWGPEERVDVHEAVRAYTSVGAWQDFAETWKGRIAPGQVADLCVVDARLLDDDPHDWARAEVAATAIGGELVHGEW